MSNGLTLGDSLQSNNACQAQVQQSPPRTVKEHMQSKVDRARADLEKALLNQAKAEVLGMNDWPHADIAAIIDYF